MVALQTTGGAVHTPGAGGATAARALAPLLALGTRPVPDSVQRVNQAFGGQRHAALVAAQRFVVTLASSAEIRTGLCTSTSGPVGGATCNDYDGFQRITPRFSCIFLRQSTKLLFEM